MRRVLVLMSLLGASCSGCAGSLYLQVDVTHQARCTLVRAPGVLPWALAPKRLQDMPMSECLATIERILQGWEQRP